MAMKDTTPLQYIQFEQIGAVFLGMTKWTVTNDEMCLIFLGFGEFGPTQTQGINAWT